MNYRIGICGVGFVGGAIKESLLGKNFVMGVDLFVYDKCKGEGKFEDLLRSNILFLALPTPFSEEGKSFDLGILNEVIEELFEYQYGGVVVLKSTVEPGTTLAFVERYKLNMVHNPEFLSARTAVEDFNRQKHVVLGIDYVSPGSKLLVDFYGEYFPGAVVSVCSSMESESMKLFVNNFYAMKVQFFTEMYLLCEKMNIKYDVVKGLMLNNGWISPFHTNVPGVDGRVSFGGMCFPKDTKALLYFMKKMDSPCSLVEAVIEERATLRND